MKKKSILQCLAFLVFVILASCGGTSGNANNDEENIETEEQPAAIKSPRKQSEGEIGGIGVKIDYGSPFVKNRQGEIWGKMEEYGKVWRAGANETTSIEFSGDVIVAGQEIAAGKYGFFIIPREESEWVVIFNTHWSVDEHGIWGNMGYNDENDVARIHVNPVWTEELQESLQYTVSGSSIDLGWEYLRIRLPVEAKKSED